MIRMGKRVIKNYEKRIEHHPLFISTARRDRSVFVLRWEFTHAICIHTHAPNRYTFYILGKLVRIMYHQILTLKTIKSNLSIHKEAQCVCVSV